MIWIGLSVYILFGHTVTKVHSGDLINDAEVEGVLNKEKSLSWKLTPAAGENSATLRICLDNKFTKYIASGSLTSFTSIEPNTIYTDRIKVEVANQIHILTIKKVNHTDDRTFYAVALFSKGPDPVLPSKKTTVKLTVVANPEFIKVPGPIIYFNQSSGNNVEVIATGIPQPSVKWLFFGDTSTKTGIATGNIMEYSYTYDFPELRKEHCGQNITCTLSRGNNSITNSSTVMVLFTPADPTNVKSNRGVVTIITVSWDHVPFGLCTVTYKVELINTTNNVLRTITTTGTNVGFPFTSATTSYNVTTARVTAIFQGKSSSPTEVIVPKEIITTPKPTTPNKTPVTECTKECNHAGAIAGGVVAAIISIVITAIIFCILGRRSITSKSGNSDEPEEAYYNISANRVNAATEQDSNYTELNTVQPSLYTDLNAVANVNEGDQNNSQYTNIMKDYEVMPNANP